MVRRFCLLLMALCALLCGGCGDLPDVSDPVSEPPLPPVSDVPSGIQVFSLAYSHDDTLNPFSATTEVNLNLTRLLYDSLTVLGEGFVPQPSLAAQVTVPDPTHLVATLREGAVFSDGSAVTATDVAKSFQAAKASENYQALLANVAAAKGNDKQRQITFTLTSADPNGLACLTFPVVKAATLTAEPAKAPLGGGAYVYESTDTGARLVDNPHHPASPRYTVSLRHLPNSAAMYYALSSGDVTYYFDDLSEGELPRVTGANRSVAMNDLVYLGVNGYSGKMADATVRRAVSGLLDRSAIVKSAYSDWALASAMPFHPGWQAVASYDAPSTARDLDGAMTLLDAAGCKAVGGVRLSLELIYCTDRADRSKVAELVRSQLEGGGIAVTPVPLKKEEYLRRLNSGKYDLYLGEIHLTADMSLRPFLQGGGTAYGIQRYGAAGTAYGQYLSGEASLEAFLAAFAEDMPYIPLCWRNGLAAFDRRLTAVTPTGYDPYYGLAEWK